MPVGMVILLALSVLVFLGLAQRVLDRLGLTDRAALLFIGAMLVGGFLPALRFTPNLAINIGGGIIPVFLIGFLFFRAGTAAERARAALALLATAVIVYLLFKILPLEPTYPMLLDPLYLMAILAGIAGYLAGRSRRAAFIAGTGGMILNDLFSRIELIFTGGSSNMVIGGAGIFDAVLISGLIALGLAELVGEVRERLAGGPSEERPAELLTGLSEPGREKEGGRSDEEG